MSATVVFFGPPGSGKGTQASRLATALGVPQISTGDIFRALKHAETPLAQEVRDIMQRGQLVPDELTIQLVKERTSQPDAQNGYILDGFPRTTEQARSLERLAAEQNNDIVAVLIDVPCELLEQRMTGRRNCPVCNEIYNIYFKPPRNDNVCDLHPEVQLVQRADDNSQTVRSRLATYEEQTRPLVEYYKAAGLLHTVDGTREPEAIYDDVVRVLPQMSTD